MEQQRFFYTNHIARWLAKGIERGCNRFLACVFCAFSIGSARAKADLAVGNGSDDGLLRRDELDLSHCIGERFAGKHDLASESCAGMGIDRCRHVLGRTNNAPRLDHDEHMRRGRAFYYHDGVYVRHAWVGTPVVVTRVGRCVGALLCRRHHEHEGAQVSRVGVANCAESYCNRIGHVAIGLAERSFNAYRQNVAVIGWHRNVSNGAAVFAVCPCAANDTESSRIPHHPPRANTSTCMGSCDSLRRPNLYAAELVDMGGSRFHLVWPDDSLCMAS